MRCVDPGHSYELSTLGGNGAPATLVFVKRSGDGYPGNIGEHPGTTLQEVWRASLDRLKYLDWQNPSTYNAVAIASIQQAISALEDRAADRHGRNHNTLEDNCRGIQCPKMLARRM